MQKEIASYKSELEKATNEVQQADLTHNVGEICVYVDFDGNRMEVERGKNQHGWRICASHLFLFRFIKSVPHIFIPTISKNAKKMKGCYDFSSSGALGPNESFAECIVRETKEELNIDISNIEKKPIFITEDKNYIGYGVIFIAEWDRDIPKTEDYECVEWMNKSSVLNAITRDMKYDEKVFLTYNLDLLFDKINSLRNSTLKEVNLTVPLKSIVPLNKTITCDKAKIRTGVGLKDIQSLLKVSNLPRITSSFNAVWTKNELNAMNLLLDYLYDTWGIIINNDNDIIEVLNSVISAINNLPPPVVLPDFSSYAVNYHTGIPGGPVTSVNSSAFALPLVPPGVYFYTVRYSVECTSSNAGRNGCELAINADPPLLADYHDEQYSAQVMMKSYVSWFRFELLATSQVTITANTNIVGTTTTILADVAVTTNSS
jgi:8-oxo-dGTP pyrophosphatase MutT (NUDIX family)